MSYFGAVNLKDETGIPYGVKHILNKPRVSSMPYLYDIAEGNIVDHEVWSKLGFNPLIKNVEEDIIPQGGLYVFPAAATKMDLVSTQAVDKGTAAPGVGARTVTIYGLTADGTAVSETVTLNGATPVQTVNTYYRINNMRVASVGASLVPVGDLTLSETGGTTYKYGYIRAGFTRQRTAIYTVPKTKTLYITSVTFTATSGAAGHWLRYTLRATYDEKSNTVLSAGFYMPHIEAQIQDQAITRDFELPIRFPAGTDLKVSGIADASGADEVCSLTLRGWLETA